MGKIKTSITLSDKTLHEVDLLLQEDGNRSAFIESAIQFYIAQKFREQRDLRDLELINKNSESLNKEAEDVLGYQSLF